MGFLWSQWQQQYFPYQCGPTWPDGNDSTITIFLGCFPLHVCHFVHDIIASQNMQGKSIHAQIYHPAIGVLKPLLQEQKVYYIDSFTVRYANRSYRPVENNLMILFTKWTTLEECIDPPADFPSVTFSLTSFGDIPPLVDKTLFYVGNNKHLCHCIHHVHAMRYHIVDPFPILCK